MDTDKIPTLDRLSAAIDVLAWLGGQAGELPDDRTNGAIMHGHLAIASLYVGEYSKHLLDGMEPYDALLATARGELKLTQRQQDMARALMPPLPDPDAGR